MLIFIVSLGWIGVVSPRQNKIGIVNFHAVILPMLTKGVDMVVLTVYVVKPTHI